MGQFLDTAVRRPIDQEKVREIGTAFNSASLDEIWDALEGSFDGDDLLALMRRIECEVRA